MAIAGHHAFPFSINRQAPLFINLGASLHTSISIENLELYGFHGYFDEEQHLGQQFVFNVLANLAPAESHLDDSLSASARYDQLIQEVERISNQTKFRTLEALGETIARATPSF